MTPTATMRLHETPAGRSDPPERRPASGPSRVPGLTLVDHPDRRRVGERATLVQLARGGESHLSRLEPLFAAPGRGDGRPLGDLHLSRRPIRLLPGSEPGSVAVDCSATRTPVEVEGHRLEHGRIFRASEIERGVVLLLSRRVALVLHSLSPAPSPVPPRFGLVGESSGVVRVRQEIQQAASLDVPVLLRGETGTGKDVVARAIHGASARRRNPFVAVNMGAVPVSLAASELFGATRGAYTGADRAKAGFFRHAHGGTLFLDEIGETPLEVQGLLLRALESGEIQPVGSVQHETVDLRVITATDAAIESSIASGRFRAPLYYRLAGYLIRVPPLRERRDDVSRLLLHFLDQELASEEGIEYAQGADGRPWPPAAVMARLARYDWPGNVRELRNVARRLAIAYRTGTGAVLEPLLEELLGQAAEPRSAAGHVAAHPRPAHAPEVPAHEVPPPRRRRFRKASEVSGAELVEALEGHGWRVKPAAAALGVSRATLYRLMETSPHVRKASELGRGEIEAALDRHSGDLDAAATDLEVSPEGLRLRMTSLGMR